MDTLTETDDLLEAYLQLEVLQLEVFAGQAILLAERLRRPTPLSITEHDVYGQVRRSALRSLATLASHAPTLIALGLTLPWIGELQRSRRDVIDLADQLLSRADDHVIDLT